MDLSCHCGGSYYPSRRVLLTNGMHHPLGSTSPDTPSGQVASDFMEILIYVFGLRAILDPRRFASQTQELEALHIYLRCTAYLLGYCDG